MRYFGYTLLGIVFFALLLALGLGTSWFGLVTQRPMAKYQVETSRQAYQNSVAHQQGADSGIGIACGNMRNASLTAPERHSYASLVTSTAAGYGGLAELSPDSRACVREARDLLATPLP